MQSTILVGIGAGLAAAALYSTVISYSLLAIVLLYLAPLPLFIAGLGWGAVTAGIGALTGTATMAFAAGLRPGLLFLLSVGIAPTLISYVALLSRDTTEAVDHEGAPVAGGRDYYPEGRLVLWTALVAGLLITATILMLGPDAESFRATLREAINRVLAAQPAPGGPAGTEAERAALVDLFVRLMPPASGVLWLIASLVNLYLAARIVVMSGRTLRPWAPFSALAFPRSAALAPLAALIAALLPGTIGLIGEVFVALLLTAFAIVGLATIHKRTLGMASRPLLLGALYATIIVFNWLVVLALSGLGIAQTLMRPAVGPSQGGPPTTT
ncbi:DUF2232 domain-containing protein [Rhodoligotrophos defluvii]|uniref:DUF2232 domain-containing protein n=1 Tax=Rhodoligotrophos defluvii TaxID=2561934 RepID=UPI0010C9E50D|nr:DUF2232 domain-containing protein [Rhodoligotrophos defluvii]